MIIKSTCENSTFKINSFICETNAHNFYKIFKQLK